MMKTAVLVLVLGIGSAAADEIDVLKARLLTPKVIERFHGELELTEEQKARLVELRDEAEVEAKSLGAEVESGYRAMEALLGGGEAGEAEASAALASLLEKEAALKQAHLRFLLGIRRELTEEQLERGLELASVPQPEREALEARVTEKAGRLTAAFENLGVEPPARLKEKGEALEALIKAGKLSEAEAALDGLITETRLEDLGKVPVPNFQTQATGATDVESLKARYLEVQRKVQEVGSLPLLSQLLDARDEFEDAREQEDLERLGRVLTWAEEALGEN